MDSCADLQTRVLMVFTRSPFLPVANPNVLFNSVQIYKPKWVLILSTRSPFLPVAARPADWQNSFNTATVSLLSWKKDKYNKRITTNKKKIKKKIVLKVRYQDTLYQPIECLSYDAWQSARLLVNNSAFSLFRVK